MKNKAIIFDLDGTLIDSLEDIAVCMNQVLEELNIPSHKIEDYKYFVGGGISILVDNALDKNTDEETKELRDLSKTITLQRNARSAITNLDNVFESLFTV